MPWQTVASNVAVKWDAVKGSTMMELVCQNWLRMQSTERFQACLVVNEVTCDDAWTGLRASHAERSVLLAAISAGTRQ
jgi:hypothetical protein